MDQLTEPQRGLLWLLDQLLGVDGPEGLQRFLKESTLHAVFFLASERKILPYDTAPVLFDWHGDTRYVCLSQEGIEDLSALERLGLIQRLELTGNYHGLFSAYRMTAEGREEGGKATLDLKAKLEPLIRCGCGERWDYITGDERVERSCPKCKKREEIGCLEIPELPYASRPRFPRLLGLSFPTEETEETE